MKPYITVVIPCLNEEHFLPHLLKNLNSQTYTDFEVIVVDGKSEDKTVEITQNFKAKYHLSIYSSPSRGVSFQRNYGAKKALGEILIFFDADTQIPHDYLQKIANIFKTKKPDFLTTYIKVNSKKPLEKIYASLSNILFEIGKVSKSFNSYGAMQAVKKEAFSQVKGYDTKTRFGEDEQLFTKLYQRGYQYLLLKNPKYIFSMRRFQNNGALKPLIQQIRINIDIFNHGHHHSKLAAKYQMGGKQYQLK